MLGFINNLYFNGDVMPKLAFYIDQKTLVDKSISWWNNSIINHVEIILDDGYSYSSSPVDGGVRRKIIDFNQDKWIFIECDWIDEDRVKDFFKETEGQKYDWLALIMSHVINAGHHSDTRWFCSEWCAAALGFHNPHRFTPASLFDVIFFIQSIRTKDC